MSKNRADLSFAVFDNDLGHSSVWRAWVTRHGDIYVASRNMAHIDKISFHRSGICRRAFTSEYGTPSGMKDRVMGRWMRPAVPAAGSNLGVQICLVLFPSNYLSRREVKIKRSTKTVPAAPSGSTTSVQFALTHDVIADADGHVTYPDGGLLLWVNVFDDVYLIVRWFHQVEDLGDIVTKNPDGEPGVRCVHPELEQPERPITLTMFLPPVVKDCLFIVERSGCVDN